MAAVSVRKKKSFARSSKPVVRMCVLDHGDMTMTCVEPLWPIPMRAIGAQNLLTMPGGVSTSGYLHKKGGSQFSLMKWPLRFIIIHKGCVYYFKSSTSASPQGAFSLNGYNRVMRAAEETTSSNVFPFKIVHFSRKHRTWLFSAASEEERRSWMKHLRREIDHYNDRQDSHTPSSDTDSDADSFYGSIERPLEIRHTVENPDDDYVEEDDDDEDEDYLRPDSPPPHTGRPTGPPPSYPPPPVPALSNKLHSHSSKAPPLPPPISRIPTSPLPKKLPPPVSPSAFSHKATPTSPLPAYKPAPASFVPAHKGPPPAVPPPAFLQSVSLKGPPPVPPFASHHQETPPLPPPNPRRTTSAKPAPPETPERPPTAARSVCEQLEARLRLQPSPAHTRSRSPSHSPAHTLSNSPSHSPAHTLSNSPSHSPNNTLSHGPAPVSSNNWKFQLPPKPGPTQTAPGPGPGPGPAQIGLRPKPPPPCSKPPVPSSRKPNTNSSSSPSSACPLGRASPEGQSFRSSAEELPPELRGRWESNKRNADQSDDDDYENVQLPDTVFMDTTETSFVEKLFRESGDCPDGLYAIRNSGTKTAKVLVVWDITICKSRNYRLFEENGCIFLDRDVTFPSLAILIEHYYSHTLPQHDSLRLTQPFTRTC